MAALRSGEAHRLGIILDVSKGGLALRYIDGSQGQAGEAAVLEIIVGSDGFLLEDVPVQVVADFETGNDFSFSLLPVRRCSIEFGELTAEQRIKLEQFINSYATETRTASAR